MPRCWAQATPATGTRPAGKLASEAGTSIRADVLIGPFGDQPRSVQ